MPRRVTSLKTFAGKFNMERPIIVKCRYQFWCVVLAAFLLWYLLLCLYHSEFIFRKNPLTLSENIAYDESIEAHKSNLLPNVAEKESINVTRNKNVYLGEDNGFEMSFNEEEIDKLFDIEKEELDNNDEEESENKNGSIKKTKIEPNCTGRYIFVQTIPRGFNNDILRDCQWISNWTNMCEFTANLGLGPHLINTEKVYSNTGWFATNQFLLEVIFHNRMKQYDCLTTNPSMASAIFVPYYAGLDVSRYLWGTTAAMRDWGSIALVKFLRNRPEWKRMRGRDHFFVAGRITWDFRRGRDGDSDWGTKLMLLPEAKRMTILTIESSPWNNNDFAIPYPTYFHPSNDSEVFNWQRRMRTQQRRYLFSFAGGPRPDIPNSIRKEIIDQCRNAGSKCGLLECIEGSYKCYKPVLLMKMFQSSVFCLQPPGDSFTRRSSFDSILAGCIPVFFHPGSAYVQYLWHLPKDYTKYSVFISTSDVKNGTVSIEKVLSKIPQEKVKAMREEVINLIPRIIYADPNSRLETLEDAFDIAVKGVVDRVNAIKKEMEEGKDSSLDYIEEYTWKYNLFGTTKKHEWDPFFARQ